MGIAVERSGYDGGNLDFLGSLIVEQIFVGIGACKEC
jgi:hypothetical protein